MKFLKNKNAFTLFELVISLVISSILFFIIFSFLSNNSEELSRWSYRINMFDEWFSFRDKLNRFIMWWYIDMSIISLRDNDVLFLKDAYDEEWVIFWVVNKNNMKLQEDYLYWNNVLWYRLLSSIEIDDIINDNSVIYDYTFFKDKLYDWIKIKDFKVDLYNSWTIVDIDMNFLSSYNSVYDWLPFSWNEFLFGDFYEFNLNF